MRRARKQFPRSNADAVTHISVSQKLAALNIGAGGKVTLSEGAPAALAEPDDAADELFSALAGGSGNVAFSPPAVPEPNNASILLAGFAMLLGWRRCRSCR